MNLLKSTLLIGSVLAASSSWAQATNWLVTCSNQSTGDILMCEAAQSIVVPENNQRVATLRMIKEAGVSETLAAMTLPLGLYLPAGVALSAGEAVIGEVPIEACDADGCYAALTLPDAWQTELEGQDLIVLTGETQGREPITFSFTLEGFGTSWGLIP